MIEQEDKSAQPAASYWPIEVRRVFLSLHEIPWLGLTALGTLIGVFALFAYFWSIDYVPTDLSALVSLGLTASVGVVGYLAIFAVGLISPVALYLHFLAESTTKQRRSVSHFRRWELAALQLGGVGLTFGVSAFRSYQRYGNYFTGEIAIACIAAAFWLVASVFICRRPGGSTQKVERFLICVGIGVFGSIPFLVIAPALTALNFAPAVAISTLLVIWALVIFVNAIAAWKVPVREVVLVSLLIVCVLYLALPLMTKDRSLVPTKVATLLGVRVEREQVLTVPPKTCNLIQSARGSAKPLLAVECVGDWGIVHAKILSTVGDQWLIEIPVEAGTVKSTLGVLRVTVPKSEIQYARFETRQ